jgi:uncharacterized membrane protein
VFGRFFFSAATRRKAATAADTYQTRIFGVILLENSNILQYSIILL